MSHDVAHDASLARGFLLGHKGDHGPFIDMSPKEHVEVASRMAKVKAHITQRLLFVQ